MEISKQNILASSKFEQEYLKLYITDFIIIRTVLLYFCYLYFIVMILGALLANKRYPLIKYFCVLLIVIGVALFLYKDVSRPSLLLSVLT